MLLHPKKTQLAKYAHCPPSPTVHPQGLIVVSPDHLSSGTSVVSALFCMRKAVLAERFKGLGGGSRVMLVGTLVHELIQTVMEKVGPMSWLLSTLKLENFLP